MNENKEIEELLIRLSKVSSDMTNSVNSNFGAATKKQMLEQERVVRKLSKKLELDEQYLNERLSE